MERNATQRDENQINPTTNTLRPVAGRIQTYFFHGWLVGPAKRLVVTIPENSTLSLENWILDGVHGWVKDYLVGVYRPKGKRQ